MSEPCRLLDGGDGGDGGDVPELEKSLLRSWSSRQPSDAARLKTLAALGVSGAIGGAAVGGGASLAPKAAAATASVMKWLGLAGGVVATVGAVSYVTMQQAGRTPVAPPARARAVETETAHVSTGTPSPASKTAPKPGTVSTEAPAGVPWTEAVPPPAPLPKVAPTPGGGSRAATPPVTSSLQDEVAMIDSGRRALAKGDAQTTLDAVDAYDARFPGGALTQESEELRIEALLRASKRPQAEKLAARFLSAHPSSPYARVIRGLVAAPARSE